MSDVIESEATSIFIQLDETFLHSLSTAMDCYKNEAKQIFSGTEMADQLVGKMKSRMQFSNLYLKENDVEINKGKLVFLWSILPMIMMVT